MNRTVLATIATIGAAVIGTGAAKAEKLIAAFGVTQTHVIYTQGINGWLTCVKAAAGDAFEFDEYPSGQISGNENAVNALQQGLAQLSLVVPGYETEKLPLTNIGNLPGMGSRVEAMNANFRTMTENGSPLAKEWEALGIVPLASFFTPTYQILTVTEPLDTLDKLRGKKIRASAGPQSFVVEALGAVPVEMTAGDLYMAMQRGTVDGTLLSLTSSVGYKLEEILKSGTLNGDFMAGQSVWAIGKPTWEALSEDQRKTMMDCGRQTEAGMGRFLDAQNDQLAADFATKGIAMYAYPDAVRDEIGTRLATVAESFVKSLESHGLPAAETYKQYLEVIANGPK